MCIATDESFFVLRYAPEIVAAAQESKEQMTEDGIEDAFEVRNTYESTNSVNMQRVIGAEYKSL